MHLNRKEEQRGYLGYTDEHNLTDETKKKQKQVTHTETQIKTHDTATGEIKGQNTEKNMGKQTIQGPGLQSFYLDKTTRTDNH